jgi:hypothetical protein
MLFFKDPNGEVRCIEDSAYLASLPIGSIAITDAEAQAILTPPPTYDQLLYSLTASYEEAISEDLLFTPSLNTGYYFQVDKKSIEELNSTVQQCTSKKLPDNFYWISKDNTKVPVTYDDLTGLVEAYFIRKTVEFNKYQARKAALKKEFNG